MNGFIGPDETVGLVIERTAEGVIRTPCLGKKCGTNRFQTPCLGKKCGTNRFQTEGAEHAAKQKLSRKAEKDKYLSFGLS